MQLFYSPDISKKGDTYTFSREESKHIIKVLRKQQDDTITITDGKGYFYTGTITNTNPNKCSVTITQATPQNKHSYHLHLAVAPTKLNDRFEWFLEKATEIGVDEITPILCDHSERKMIKQDRFNRIIESAMKQSLKAHMPKLNPLTPFSDFIDMQATVDQVRCIAYCEDSEKEALDNLVKHKDKILIVIGPEGDFSISEIKYAQENNFTTITLGRSRLRTETAAIVACHSIAFINNV